MKKEDITLEILLEKFNRDIISNDLRIISLIGGYYLDFLLELNLEAKLKNPNRWTKNLHFDGKVNLLESIGFFDNPTKNHQKDGNVKIVYQIILPPYQMSNVLEDIKILNKVRNHYAHHIIDDLEEIPSELKPELGRLYLNEVVKPNKVSNPKELIRLSFIGVFSKLLIGTKLYDFKKSLEFYNNLINGDSSEIGNYR